MLIETSSFDIFTVSLRFDWCIFFKVFATFISDWERKSKREWEEEEREMNREPKYSRQTDWYASKKKSFLNFPFSFVENGYMQRMTLKEDDFKCMILKVASVFKMRLNPNFFWSFSTRIFLKRATVFRRNRQRLLIAKMPTSDTRHLEWI